MVRSAYLLSAYTHCITQNYQHSRYHDVQLREIALNLSTASDWHPAIGQLALKQFGA